MPYGFFFTQWMLPLPLGNARSQSPCTGLCCHGVRAAGMYAPVYHFSAWVQSSISSACYNTSIPVVNWCCHCAKQDASVITPSV